LKSWKFWLGVAVSAACVYWAFSDVDPARFAEAVLTANYWVIAPVSVFIGVILYVRAFRWKYLIAHVKQIPTYPLWLATCIGFAVNNLLPARIGELARSYALSKTQQVPFAATFATVVVERLWDGLSIFLVLIIAFAAWEFPAFEEVVGVSQSHVLWGTALTFSAVLAFVVFLRVKSEFTLRVIGFFLRPLPEKARAAVLSAMRTLIQGFGQSKRPADVAAVVFLSFFLWAISLLAAWAIVASYGIFLSVQQILLVMFAAVFAIMVPASPGYIGTYHVLTKKALVYCGLPPEQALAVATMIHLANYVPQTLLGLFALWREDIAFSEIRKVRAKEG